MGQEAADWLLQTVDLDAINMGTAAREETTHAQYPVIATVK